MNEWNISGRTALITGGTTGIGYATAAELAGRGATVVLGVRDTDRGESAAATISAATGNRPVVLELDLASLDSVRVAAGRIGSDHPELTVLINNAGVFLGRRRTTEDGFEGTMATNHLGHYLLTCLVGPLLLANAPSRVITVSSGAHHRARLDLEDLHMEGTYRATRAYANSKLANVMFTRELARRLEGTNVSAYAVHPGLTATRIAQDGDSVLGAALWKLMRRRFATPAEGADTVIWLATEPSIEPVPGSYFYERRQASPSRAARDQEACARLWRLSEELTGCRWR